MKGYDAVDNNSPYLAHWSFYWHYESPSCTNAVPTIRSTTGARLIANNSSYADFALFDLSGVNSDPRNRADITPYFLGWDRSGIAGSSGVGIHHPAGDIKKISTYTTTPKSTSYPHDIENANGSYWNVIWAETANGHGITEDGSSGSPLINNNRRIIGQLKGRLSTCNAKTAPAWYGKFSVSWTGNNNDSPQRRLRDWLAPGLSNPPSTLNGTANRDCTAPRVTSISGNTSVPNGQYANYRANTNSGSQPITNYQWILNPQLNNNLYGANTSSLDIAFYTAGNYQLVCRAYNACGWSDYFVTNLNVYNRSSYAIAYPSPVSDVLTVSFNSEKIEETKASLQSSNSARRGSFLLDIKLYDIYGTLAHQATSSSENITINVSNLKSGIYVLHVFDGISTVPEVHKVIVKR